MWMQTLQHWPTWLHPSIQWRNGCDTGLCRGKPRSMPARTAPLKQRSSPMPLSQIEMASRAVWISCHSAASTRPMQMQQHSTAKPIKSKTIKWLVDFRSNRQHQPADNRRCQSPICSPLWTERSSIQWHHTISAGARAQYRGITV